MVLSVSPIRDLKILVGHKSHKLLVRTTCKLAKAGLSCTFMISPAELAASFRAQGRKLTPQRLLLFTLLYGNDKHPTAESLFSTATTQMPGISLRTVYQTLNELAEMGELQMIDIGPGAARFDPNVDDHHHVVCDGCGEIRDAYVKGATALRPQGFENFNITEVGVTFRGTCRKCSDLRRRKRSKINSN